MASFKVSFVYVRTVVTHLEAESEEDIEDFLEDNEDWDLLDGNPIMVDSDETEAGADYTVEECPEVSPDFALVGGQIVEVSL